MWIDLNKAGDFAFPAGYDVCVCGSGPAGMTVARRLKDAGARVLLLEAGGLEPSEVSQSAYAGKSVGPQIYYGVEACRLRYFGGSSNHWTGMCTRLDEIDFEERGNREMPGWPIAFEDIYRYENEARAILDIADEPFDRKDFPLWRDPRLRPGRVAFSPPTRFGEKYKAELEASSNLDVALNANVVDARLDDGKRALRELVVVNYGGKEFAVTAKYFVIAFGGLENPRFLLNARADNEAGLGNEHDLVGRCFMEHFDLTLGRFVGLGAPIWNHGGLSLSPSPEVMRARGIGNSFLSLSADAQLKFYGRLAFMRRAIRDLTCSSDFLLERARRKRDFLCEGDGIVTTIMEQSSSRSSRVMLDDDERDRFGRARLKVDWRINDQDLKTMRALAEEVGKSLAAQNFGRLRITPEILAGEPQLGMHCHHLGTTRMSAAARDGVVDGDCRAHGVDNLYIGGSSVFPTGGGCNPTFTIVCLALRLGDHLARRLGKA
ncbi:MAG: GMC family oxidoreductase [Parvularculaceae bacterium]